MLKLKILVFIARLDQLNKRIEEAQQTGNTTLEAKLVAQQWRVSDMLDNLITITEDNN